MRLISVAASAVVAVTAFATAAEAGGASVDYAGLRGSFVDADDGDTTSSSIDFSENYQDGFAVAVFAGWVLDESFRLELEAGYRGTDLDSIFLRRNDFDPPTEGASYSVGGHAEAATFMTNLYYDIHFLGDIGVLPWIGAGVGAAYIDYEISEPTAILAAQDNTWAFAYQLMAGITVPLGDSLSGSVGYRFFQTEDFSYAGFETNLTQQSIDVGLQFHL